MPQDDLFESAEYLVAWAKEQTADLAAIRKAFFEEPNVVAKVTEFDPQSGQNIVKIRLLKPLPSSARGLSINIIKNFRDAFDQAVYAATFRISGRKSNRAHFPFGESPDDLENSLFRRKVTICKGIPDALFPVLRRCEPYPRSDAYPGGNDALRALGRIAGPHKHEISLRAIGEAGGVEVASNKMFEVGPGGGSMFIAPQWDGEKNEISLFSFPPGGYFNTEIKVTMCITFGPGPLKDVDVEQFFGVLGHDIPMIIGLIKDEAANIASASNPPNHG